MSFNLIKNFGKDICEYLCVFRFSNHETSFEKPVRPIESDPSDSDETDDDDIEGTNVKKPIELYNPKEFENLEASAEVKELFQNIMR